MKKTLKWVKNVAVATTIIVLFQSCQVYYHASISVDEATKTKETQLKKLKTKRGKTYKLNSIEVVNETIYGQRRQFGKVYHWYFKEEDIKSIQLLTVSKSDLENSLTRIEPTKAYISILYYLQWRMGGFVYP